MSSLSTDLPAPLVDSHCHLDFPQFDHEQADIIQRANQAGVVAMVTIATRVSSVHTNQKLANTYPSVFYAFGNHPLHVDETPLAHSDDLIALSDHPKCIAIGESGLDYHYRNDNKERQIQSFRAHIAAARETKLPLIVHARAADDDISSILTDEYKNGAFACVMHCFSSGAALAKTALDLGFYLSMSGIITFKKSNALRDIFQNVPRDRILVETDAPYLAPTPYRGKRNEPAYTVHTAHIGADIVGMAYADFAQQTTHNFYALFSKAKRNATITPTE